MTKKLETLFNLDSKDDTLKKSAETELSGISVSSDDTPPSPKSTKEDLPTIFEDAP